jgi:hypothetical protein
VNVGPGVTVPHITLGNTILHKYYTPMHLHVCVYTILQTDSYMSPYMSPICHPYRCQTRCTYMSVLRPYYISVLGCRLYVPYNAVRPYAHTCLFLDHITYRCRCVGCTDVGVYAATCGWLDQLTYIHLYVRCRQILLPFAALVRRSNADDIPDLA